MILDGKNRVVLHDSAVVILGVNRLQVVNRDPGINLGETRVASPWNNLVVPFLPIGLLRRILPKTQAMLLDTSLDRKC